MMNLILSIFLVFSLFLFILELLTICTYGFYISKSQQDLILNKNPYVGTIPFSLICKYHIKNYGVVPRWYKLHNILNEYYIKAK